MGEQMENNSCIFILEQPYTSELLLKTIEKNQYTVLKNSESMKYKRLNPVDTEEIKNFSSKGDIKIYSNSENAIDIVLNKFEDSKIAKYINICKNKYLMRQKLSPLYPDFFYKAVSIDDIAKTDMSDFPDSFIIKPSVGFLSKGVHKVNSKADWGKTVSQIKSEINDFKKMFPMSVLSASEFLAEEIIKGEEYAIDVYFDNLGNANILNIFKHPFVSEDDVSDRAYITSKNIIKSNLKPFETILNKIGKIIEFKNFPTHIEVIKTKNGEIIPVEINPMRFAGWCTTDLAYYAYGINVYEYFVNNKKPDWNNILASMGDEIFYFAMAETPSDTDKEHITFDYISFKNEFSKILEFREIDFINKPVFAIVFGEAKDNEEITKILKLNMKDFIKNKNKITI